MIHWYGTVLEAEVLHRTDALAFMTFDEEHHRLVIWTDETTTERSPDAAGFDHICIGLAHFADLAKAYQRLKASGLMPVLPVNHRFTTSLYYKDPDGNEVELSVDNFATKKEGVAFVRGEELTPILTPPFGDLFDPEDLVKMVDQGATDAQMAMIGRA